MPILNGFQASRMIKNLITKENYIECKIVGYTCYEGDEKKCKVWNGFIFIKACIGKHFYLIHGKYCFEKLINFFF